MNFRITDPLSLLLIGVDMYNAGVDEAPPPRRLSGHGHSSTTCRARCKSSTSSFFLLQMQELAIVFYKSEWDQVFKSFIFKIMF